VVKYSFKV